MRVVLLLSTIYAVKSQAAEEDRLDFSYTPTNKLATSEHVVSGTISLNGTISPEIVSRLNWAAENALVQACGHGTKVLSSAILQLSWQARRGVDIKFHLLPRLGGGGDCSMTLVEASAGGYSPPFPLTGPNRKPTFRNMMQNELALLGYTALMSDYYMRLWRVTCSVRDIFRPANQLTHSTSVTACSTYAVGWEVYYEATLTEPATAVGAGLGYSPGNSDSVVSGLDDSCNVANSACFCSSLGSCAWRLRADGISMQCQTLAAGDTARRVPCNACSQQPDCPPSCASASFACQCATMANCHWDVANLECVTGSGDVTCNSCVLQDKCQAARPRAVEFGPNTIFALPRSGPLSIIEISFNQLLALPSARGAVNFVCGADGRDPAPNALTLTNYLVPDDAFSVEGSKLMLESGKVKIQEPTSCTLVVSDGVVVNLDGLPSKPVAFGAFYFKLKDSIPPEVAAFFPANGAGSVQTRTRYLTITFNERIRSTDAFAAFLTLTDLFGNQLGTPQPLPLEGVSDRDVKLLVEGLLEPGRYYEITLSGESVIDYGNLNFAGLDVGDYKIKTEGSHDDVRIIQEEEAPVPTGLIAAIAGVAVVAILTGVFLLYRSYLASCEKDDLTTFDDDVEPTVDNKPHTKFDQSALHDMQIDEMPETPHNRPDSFSSPAGGRPTRCYSVSTRRSPATSCGRRQLWRRVLAALRAAVS
ncbi:unnamed protein product [Effrenium voratum]|nr:unnamed protein product [Effrenium voratum]